MSNKVSSQELKDVVFKLEQSIFKNHVSLHLRIQDLERKLYITETIQTLIRKKETAAKPEGKIAQSEPTKPETSSQQGEPTDLQLALLNSIISPAMPDDNLFWLSTDFLIKKLMPQMTDKQMGMALTHLGFKRDFRRLPYAKEKTPGWLVLFKNEALEMEIRNDDNAHFYPAK